MDIELIYWVLFFASIPISTFLLTAYRIEARVAKESLGTLSSHMFAVEDEVRQLTKRNAEWGSTGSLAIQGSLFALFLYDFYYEGRVGERAAFAATFAWSIYVSAAAWGCGQLKGCKKVLQGLSVRLIEDHREISVSLENVAKLPPGLFDGLAYINIIDKLSPEKNKPKFALGPFQPRESSNSR